MGFYHTTQDLCVMMKVNPKTKSCEGMIIHQDELYIASSTLQEILHIVKEKYKIKINPNNYLESDFPYLNIIHNKITYQHYIHQISSSQALHTGFHSIHKKLPT